MRSHFQLLTTKWRKCSIWCCIKGHHITVKLDTISTNTIFLTFTLCSPIHKTTRTCIWFVSKLQLYSYSIRKYFEKHQYGNTNYAMYYTAFDYYPIIDWFYLIYVYKYICTIIFHSFWNYQASEQTSEDTILTMYIVALSESCIVTKNSIINHGTLSLMFSSHILSLMSSKT